MFTSPKLEQIASSVAFDLLWETFRQFYINEFGESKTIQIINKVHDSNKARKFLEETFKKKVRPGTDDFLIVIHSSTSFIFSKAEDVSLAGSFLLWKWNDRIGILLGISNDYFLNKVFFSLLDKCDKLKAHITGNPNFFARFYDSLYNIH